jgi:hypothetical protein
LNIDLEINNESQGCKIGTVCAGVLWEEVVNGGDEGEEYG